MIRNAPANRKSRRKLKFSFGQFMSSWGWLHQDGWRVGALVLLVSRLQHVAPATLAEIPNRRKDWRQRDFYYAMLLPLLVKSCLWGGEEELVCCCPCSSTSACLAQLQTLLPPWQFSHSRPTSQGSLVRWNRQDGSSVNVMMERFCVAGSFLPLQSEGLEFWSANHLEVLYDHIF